MYTYGALFPFKNRNIPCLFFNFPWIADRKSLSLQRPRASEIFLFAFRGEKRLHFKFGNYISVDPEILINI